MNKIVSRLPLLAKLLIIALIPIVFVVYLTFQLYQEKAANILQVKNYLGQIQQSATLTHLVGQLEREWKYSFDYSLDRTHHSEMLAQRPVTDSLIKDLELHHDPSLNKFSDYVFLEKLDSTRSHIDQHRYNSNLVVHFYSAAIFRLNTLNASPRARNAALKDVSSDLLSQKLLSDMITYLELINANVYNVLFTRQYMIETLMGTLGTYEAYNSYEKQLELTATPETVEKYQSLKEHSAVKPVTQYLHQLFATFKFDSTYSYEEWYHISDQAVSELSRLQMSLLHRAESGMNEYYESEHSAQVRTIIYLIVFSVLLVLFTTYILLVINRSLNRLSRAALAIADGDTDVRLVPHSKDSIGSLTSSILKVQESSKTLAIQAEKIGQGDFTVPLQPRSSKDMLVNALIQMKQNLLKFTSDLQKSREEFKGLADLTPQIVWTARSDGYVDYYNRRWYELLGAKEGYGDQSWIPYIHPEDVGRVIRTWKKSIEEGIPYESQYRFLFQSGNYRWFIARALPIKDAEGKVEKWFGTVTDIHDQIMQTEKLEELVAQRTLELKRSNEDLQQFAHVASHDLKEPLRKIKTFGSRLAIEFEEHIPERGKIYLEKLQRSAERMATMIEGVLNYSVVSATEQQLEPVDLNIIIDGIESDLELLIIQKQATIEVEPLPIIKGIPTLIYQLFYNLINNSLKFCKKGEQVKIDISSQLTPSPQWNKLADRLNLKEYFQITIQDNGIGFNPEYANKIFNVFTRLNSREQYEGTGLGLALCKKIVHRHHGYIYAEGKEGEGARFYILFPK
jgi:PAS domain S-box-containing protein